jgi:hypothetical protein
MYLRPTGFFTKGLFVKTSGLYVLKKTQLFIGKGHKSFLIKLKTITARTSLNHVHIYNFQHNGYSLCLISYG